MLSFYKICKNSHINAAVTSQICCCAENLLWVHENTAISVCEYGNCVISCNQSNRYSNLHKACACLFPCVCVHAFQRDFNRFVGNALIQSAASHTDKTESAPWAVGRLLLHLCIHSCLFHFRWNQVMVLLRFPSFFGIFGYVYISCCQSKDNFTCLWQKR